MFGKPSWAAVTLLIVVLLFVAGMYALGMKDIAALVASVGAIVAAVMKTAGPGDSQ